MSTWLTLIPHEVRNRLGWGR